MIDREKCKRCIHSADSELHENSVCEICFRVDNIGNGENSEFIERIEPVDCCGKCIYCMDPVRNMFVNQNHYCKASAELDMDDRRITMQYIRKNYLTKNTPKWCPLKRGNKKCH